MNTFFLALTALTLSAQAQTNVPKKITCTANHNSRVKLVIEDTGLESVGFAIPLEVSVVAESRVFERGIMRLVKNKNGELVLDGHATDGNLVRVGVSLAKRTAYRQESANGGMSPLPAAEFSNCSITN